MLDSAQELWGRKERERRAERVWGGRDGRTEGEGLTRTWLMLKLRRTTFLARAMELGRDPVKPLPTQYVIWRLVAG